MSSNLVVMAAGDDSVLLKSWQGKQRNFDLFIVYFGINSNTASRYQGMSDYFYRYSSVSKLENVQEGLLHYDVLDKYDYYFIPDDDIDISIENVELLFKIAKEHSLLICQPSCLGHPAIQRTRPVAGSLLRHVNFVEIMMPCFSREALHKTLLTFTQNKTWGVDALWPFLLKNPERGIAIVDAISGTHTRKPGTLYDRFYTNNIYPDREIYSIETYLQKDLEKLGYGSLEHFITVGKTFETIPLNLPLVFSDEQS